MRKNTKAALLLLGLMLGGAATADDQAGTSEPCASIDDDRTRLACYDRMEGRVPEAAAPGMGAPPLPEEKPTKAGDFVGGGDVVRTGDSRLGFKWELDEDSRFGVLRFRTHKPNYFLPISHSDGRNDTPYSPSLGPADTPDIDDNEAKFQLSFKTKLVQGLMNDRIDIWAAYTQQSHWQIYSPSAPFRETNYEPELMAVLHTSGTFLGLRSRFINLGFVHQSNGRGGELSRSWNRIYAQFGFERNDFSLLVRPWYRLKDQTSDGVPDNNPDIEDYLGHGDLLAFYRPAGSGNSFALLARENFKTGYGALQLDWRFPLYRNLKGYLQVFSGYGESLIDYNYRQTVIGLGFSLSDWM